MTSMTTTMPVLGKGGQRAERRVHQQSGHTYQKSEDRDIDKPSSGQKRRRMGCAITSGMGKRRTREKTSCCCGVLSLSPRRPIQIRKEQKKKKNSFAAAAGLVFFLSCCFSGAICDRRENVLFSPSLFVSFVFFPFSSLCFLSPIFIYFVSSFLLLFVERTELKRKERNEEKKKQNRKGPRKVNETTTSFCQTADLVGRARGSSLLFSCCRWLFLLLLERESAGSLMFRVPQEHGISLPSLVPLIRIV